MKSVRGLIEDMASSHPPKCKNHRVIEPLDIIFGVSLTSTGKKLLVVNHYLEHIYQGLIK